MDVEYIPLETTDDFVTMAHVQDISKDVIIVRNRNRSSDGNIYFFDKKGKGLRKINRQGPGGEEYTFLLKVILDEDNNELFVNDHINQQFLKSISKKEWKNTKCYFLKSPYPAMKFEISTGTIYILGYRS